MCGIILPVILSVIWHIAYPRAGDYGADKSRKIDRDVQFEPESQHLGCF